MAKVLAICVSDIRGIQKHRIDEAELLADHGIVGDAHAGSWHRQVSLLGVDSVDKMQEKLNIKLLPGAFADNILVEGLRVYELPVGRMSPRLRHPQGGRGLRHAPGGYFCKDPPLRPGKNRR